MSTQAKSRPNPYRGSLTLTAAVRGIVVAKENAVRLLADAKLLLENARHPSACALAVLSLEEAIKPGIIRKIILATNEEETRKGWRLFTSHLDKLTPWIIPSLIAENPETYEDLVELFMRKQDPVLLDSLKQIAIYSGCYGKSHWSAPKDVINKSVAEIIVHAALVFATSGQQTQVDSEDGLNLWKNEMAGCFSVGYVTANNRIVQFFETAKRSGIVTGELPIPLECAFDFLATAMVLSDGEVAEQRQLLDLFAGNETPGA
ncbi:MAG: AbiV family abortive infection protein [Dehalococcoidia bacterium]|nr:AbiV family abortive infection protein [Dehalococcoidia bacterium]